MKTTAWLSRSEFDPDIWAEPIAKVICSGDGLFSWVMPATPEIISTMPATAAGAVELDFLILKCVL